MQYLAQFTPDEGGFLVTFQNFPEAITGGATEAEALGNAHDALEIVALTYAQDGQRLPQPEDIRAATASQRPVSISAAVLAKISLIEAFRASGLTQAALASRLGKAETEVRRMLDPFHATKLRSIENGLLALGKRLVITVEAA